jgi:hypothetical protein
MGQAIGETVFEVAYLLGALVLGILMVLKSRPNAKEPLAAERQLEVKLFGVMTVLLSAGDAFHLVPRMYALWTAGTTIGVPASLSAALGIGEAVTSVTMTVFYVILYVIWRLHYHTLGNAGKKAEARSTALALTVFLLAGLRIGLCLAPQNQWTNPDSPLSWGIYRNIPFVLLGILMVILFAVKAKKGDAFRFMSLAITLSFLFYLPVVLFAHSYPLIGMLMLPKTCCYVWMMVMGWKNMKCR